MFGLLRCPDDLIYAIDNLFQNNYEHKLVKTEYKYINTNTKLCNYLKSNNIISITTYYNNLFNVIKFTNSLILDLIFYKIDDHLKRDIDIYDDNIKVKLIFKALNYSDYDIDPNWYNYAYIDTLGEEINIDLLDDKAIQLSEIEGWSEFVIKFLTSYSIDDSHLNIEELFEKYNTISIDFDYQQYKIKKV